MFFTGMSVLATIFGELELEEEPFLGLLILMSIAFVIVFQSFYSILTE